jgi:hypothetical protein
MNMEDISLKLSTLTCAKQISECIMSLTAERKLMTIGLLWSWWDARNNANVREQRRSIDEVIFRARMASISNENASVREAVPVSRGRNRRWDPPSEGVWKINIDGAFCEANKRGAWGSVVRDFEGKASMAGAGCIEVVADALCAEAHACVEALNAAADVGMQSIVLESDSQVLMKALQLEESDQGLGGVFFREEKFLMSTLFNTPNVRHISRSCNSAHKLAKFGRCRNPKHPIVWMDPLREFVNIFLARDLAEPEVLNKAVRLTIKKNSNSPVYARMLR